MLPPFNKTNIPVNQNLNASTRSAPYDDRIDILINNNHSAIITATLCQSKFLKIILVEIDFRSFESMMPSVILVCKDGIILSKPIIP